MLSSRLVSEKLCNFYGEIIFVLMSFFGLRFMFLLVKFQSLWHLRRFRDDFLGRSTIKHVHVGDPCVTCALYDIFSALSIAYIDIRREAVAPTSLRIALSNLYPDSNFFQEVIQLGSLYFTSFF